MLAIVPAVRAAERHERWGLLILEGLADIAAGLVALFMPGLALLFFVYLLAAWAVVSGIAMATAAFNLHIEHGRWLLFLSGLISVFWGILLSSFRERGRLCSPGD